jgi:diguanylate cyclase (GGDEF)-like protein
MEETDIELEDLRKKVKSLEYIAYHDVLTGVFNRRYGMHTLNYWLTNGNHFCIVFIDVDRLKYVNDAIGHIEGDNYLVAVSSTLKQVSSEAITCRIGGDEFMLLIPNVKEADCREMLKATQSKLAMQKDKEQRYTKSISFGIVEVNEENNKTPMHKLLSLADDLMYQDKKSKKADR